MYLGSADRLNWRREAVSACTPSHFPESAVASDRTIPRADHRKPQPISDCEVPLVQRRNKALRRAVAFLRWQERRLRRYGLDIPQVKMRLARLVLGASGA